MNNQFKYGFLGITSLLFCGACVTKQNEQLNILFITADDLGYESLGFTGNTTPDISPNIDSLATESMQFRNAFVTVSVSQPSRSSWITGRYPHRNGAVGFNPICNENPMLGKQMRKAGYFTALYGKGTHFAPITEEQWDDCVAELPNYGRDASEFEKVIVKSIKESTKRANFFCLIID